MISPGILFGPGSFLAAMANSSAVKMTAAKDLVSFIASVRARCVGNSPSNMCLMVSASFYRGPAPEFTGHILVTNSPRVSIHLFA